MATEHLWPSGCGERPQSQASEQVGVVESAVIQQILATWSFRVAAVDAVA